jgi:hypothetical membrane protein
VGHHGPGVACTTFLEMKPSIGVWLGRLAVAGPIAFTLAWLVGGVVQIQYSLRREDISALAALDAQNAWIMILGFMMLGLGAVALAAGLLSTLQGRTAVFGSVLVLIAGLGIGVAGLARTDCSSQLGSCVDRVNAGQVSWHHTLHDLVSLVVFLALVAGPLVLARAFRGDVRWSNLRGYSVVTGLGGLVLLILFVTRVTGSWNGLVQRIFVSVLFLWIAILGLRLIRILRRKSSDPRRAVG